MPSRNTLPPVFMFGFERSGTTLLSMMVGAHPDLAVPLTVTGLWYAYFEKLNAYNNLESNQDVKQLIGDLLQEERIQLWDEPVTANEVLACLEGQDYPSVVRAFHRVYADKKSKTHWANLDIATLNEMNVAYQWFPEARFLHIVRDGRDVALSHETMPFGSSNTLDCARDWYHRIATNLKMGSMLPAGSYRVIRYEDLIQEPVRTLNEICSFVGIPYSEKMLDYRTMVADKIPEHRRWLWPDLDKRPQASKSYGWKKRMSETKRVVFEGEASTLLKEFGYEIYHKQPKILSAYAYELWCFLGREGRFRRLSKKLGVARVSTLEKQWKKNHGN